MISQTSEELGRSVGEEESGDIENTKNTEHCLPDRWPKVGEAVCLKAKEEREKTCCCCWTLQGGLNLFGNWPLATFSLELATSHSLGLVPALQVLAHLDDGFQRMCQPKVRKLQVS